MKLRQQSSDPSCCSLSSGNSPCVGSEHSPMCSSGLAMNLTEKNLSVGKAVIVLGFCKSMTREAKGEKGGFLVGSLHQHQVLLECGHSFMSPKSWMPWDCRSCRCAEHWVWDCFSLITWRAVTLSMNNCVGLGQRVSSAVRTQQRHLAIFPQVKDE